MYIIQVNDANWLVGIWRGWLALSQCPSGALIYRSRSTAEKAKAFYDEALPDQSYTIQPYAVTLR